MQILAANLIDEVTEALLVEREEMLKGLEGITKAERIGAWLWVWFDKAPAESIRAKLKESGFTWAPKKAAWTYHNPAHKIGKHRAKSLDEIKEKYTTIKLF